MQVAYRFEAESIQGYLFSTGKLRDASGASELLSSLAFENSTGISAGGVLGNTFRAVNLSPTVFRCAGGVIDFTVPETDRAALVQFRAIWRLMLARKAPGLAFADALESADTQANARKAARMALFNAPPPAHADAPPAAPIIRPATRTDAAPTVWGGANKADGTCKITGEYADAATLAKRQFLNAGALVLPRLFMGDDAKNYRWPITFEKEPDRPDDPVFPLPDEPKRVALVHIDGNGVGQFFANLQRREDVDPRRVSFELALATRAAAARAMKVVLPKPGAVVPARPILLGGDDLTIIVRADLALDFARCFVEAFGEETREGFKRAGLETETGLTAKTGIVFMGPKQPFVQAYELCESLADEARAEDARVSFWRLTGAMIPRGVGELIEATTTSSLQLWKPSWSWAELDDLRVLADLLSDDDVGRGALRRVPELMLAEQKAGQDTPDVVYRRGMQVLGKRAPGTKKSFVAAMEALGVPDPDAGCAVDGYVPLLDAHNLAQIGLGGAA